MHLKSRSDSLNSFRVYGLCQRRANLERDCFPSTSVLVAAIDISNNANRNNGMALL